MKKTNLFLLLISIMVIIFFLTYVIYIKTSIYQIKTLPTEVLVGDIHGFNIDQDSLRFGILPPGASGARTFLLESDKDITVELKIKGNLSEFIYFTENNFEVKAQEKRRIPVNVVIPYNAEKANYSGTVIVTLRNV
ncbi:MAG: hypothetical protein HYS32_03235 [Candidatus Woesearchaeota archaeon]|nr:MAG: hypothetical protein HYS32_03235 [Candidatus Woesearchaeota archaeon]